MRTAIAASTACLPGVQPLPARVRDLRAHGIAAIELGAGVTVGDDLEWLVSEQGVTFLIHNYFPPPADSFVLNLASADAGIRGRSIRLVEAALDLSARLGAPFYSVHGGFITDPIGFDGTGFVFPPPQSPGESVAAMDRFARALQGLLLRARSVGVRILVENNVCVPSALGKLLLQSADEFDALFRTVPDPFLGMLLDTGHLNVTARTLGFDRVAFVDTVQAHVRAFHIHDNDGTSDRHQPVAADSWIVDILRRGALAGMPMVVESKFPDAAALASHIEWLGAALAE